MSSSASRLRQEICSWWCDGHSFEELTDGTLAVSLPVSWPDGDRLRCFVTVSESGEGVVSDWGETLSGLYLYGIHDSQVLRLYADSLGLRMDAHGVIEQKFQGPEAAAVIIASFTQLASVAAATLTAVHFSPPSMIVPAAWASVVGVEMLKHGAKVVGADALHLTPAPIFLRNNLVVLDGQKPRVASPYVSTRTPGWFTSLFYFLETAAPDLRGVVPLLKTTGAHDVDEYEKELRKRAETNGRVLEFVHTEAADEHFDRAIGDYPAMRKLQAAAGTVASVFERVRAA